MNSNYSAQEKNFATALLHNLWKYLLLAASIVATVKIIFFGFDIDEQYAVSGTGRQNVSGNVGASSDFRVLFCCLFMAVYAVVSHLKILRALSANRRCRYTVAHQYSDLPDFP